MPDWASHLIDGIGRLVTDDAARNVQRQYVPIGLAAGVFLACWSASLISRMSSRTRRIRPWGALLIIIAPALLFPAMLLAIHLMRAHDLVEAGSIDWIHWRIPFHFVLLSLLIVATAVDFDQYLIPDEITVAGMVIGIGWSTIIGNMQLVPLWIDWNELQPFEGPYIPEWLKQHSHLHGLAFSLAGLIVGAGLTWVTRRVAQSVLGVEALGAGDITLMGMIGSFLGWQPVVFVFLIAPACALLIGLTLKVLHARRAIPYGPYLSAAAVIVLFTWRWLWLPTREVFGHWPTLVGLALFVAAGTGLLLGLVRLYRAIPVTRRGDAVATTTRANEVTETAPQNAAEDAAPES